MFHHKLINENVSQGHIKEVASGGHNRLAGWVQILARTDLSCQFWQCIQSCHGFGSSVACLVEV